MLKYLKWLFSSKNVETPAPEPVEETIPEVEVPEVVQEPAAEAPAPRKPKKKYYKKKKPSNT